MYALVYNTEGKQVTWKHPDETQILAAPTALFDFSPTPNQPHEDKLDEKTVN